MNVRKPGLREAVVGLSFLAAALLLLWAGTDGTVLIAGVAVGSRAVAAGFLVAGFAIAAVLSIIDGDQKEGIGDLVAVIGWLCLLIAALTVFDFFAAIGLILVIAAGAYLVADGLGIEVSHLGRGAS